VGECELFKDRLLKERIKVDNQLVSVCLQHGDMLYVKGFPMTSSSTTTTTSQLVLPQEQRKFVCHPVDEQLRNQTGQISRPKSRYCQHMVGMCAHCTPIEPYDATYLDSKKIKHMSFYAYIRSLRDAGTLSSTSLEWQYKQRDGSSSLKIPPPITLHPQRFRNIDHVEMYQGDMEEFLSRWRETGTQQFGVLVGRLGVYDHVPLGMSVRVEAIWTLQQESGADYVQLINMDSELDRVKDQANTMGLEIVGCIFSDLFHDHQSPQQGSVVCKRHEHSYILSSAEVMFTSQMQQRFRIDTQYGSVSRFVSVVVSGNEEGGIEAKAYMVSNDCESMVSESIVEASVEPSLMRVKDTSRDVFFKQGGIVKTGKVVPVEYFLVTVILFNVA
jgi:nuclear protein localization protein 4 homolog